MPTLRMLKSSSSNSHSWSFSGKKLPWCQRTFYLWQKSEEPSQAPFRNSARFWTQEELCKVSLGLQTFQVSLTKRLTRLSIIANWITPDLLSKLLTSNINIQLASKPWMQRSATSLPSTTWEQFVAKFSLDAQNVGNSNNNRAGCFQWRRKG